MTRADVDAQVRVDAVDGAARATTVTTRRGSFPTPCFMPVGTRGAVRTLAAADLEALGAHVVLDNTYHLMLRPGADVVASLGGIHGFSGFRGHVLTDSGGFQVFSLGDGVSVDDDGVTFRSTYDGSTHRLTPEEAVAVQGQLGADIQMVLDVCTRLPAGLTEAVGLGVDMFDCVLPTRLARHGTVLTSEGRWQVRNASRLADDRPLDPSCGCSTCARHSRAYLRHLHMVEEPAAARLL